MFFRKTLTERFKDVILLSAGMQKSLRSDLGSDRGRAFLSTDDGHIGCSYTRVSVPHAQELQL